MELHTLGVDGGYTQKDVTEVARAFTGWTMGNPRAASTPRRGRGAANPGPPPRGRGAANASLPRRSGEAAEAGVFRFDPRRHDNREKVVLGHRITAGGIKDGEQVLDLLAAHPATARFISTKLARRFVSDEPPASLVGRMAARFTATGGDLREVMRTLLTSPEFRSPDAYGAKVKTPLEFVVSAVRATGAGVGDAQPLVRALQQLGMPLYQCQPPTGYKDTADAWVNSGALVNRMNFALTLASGRDAPAPDLKVGPAASATTAAATDAAGVLRGLRVSDATRATIARAATPSQAVALALGSPEFQRR
jgi:uncharacterized protein (DUF1800 family)